MAPFRGHQSRGRGGASGRGGRRPAAGGPTLPSTLMAEVDAAYGASRGGGRGHMTRKEQRKASRQDKRAGPSSRNTFVSHSDEEDVDDEEEAPLPVKAAKAQPSSKAQGKRPASPEREKETKKKRKLPELTLPGESTDDLEDGEIEWLEYMLQKEKAKAKEDGFDDGLDDLLDFADIIGPGGRGLKKDEERDEDDFDESEDDLDESEEGAEDESETGSEEDGEGSEKEDEESSQQEAGSRETPVDGDEDEAEWNGIASSSSTRSQSPSAAPPVPTTEPTRYIPPHLRAAQLAEKALGDKDKIEERRKLERRAQGLLNKLSEQNIESIVGEIEEVYRNHSRNDVTTTLTTLILQVISNRSNLLDSFVVLYATLVGALHRIIGLEFGAHFVHTLVTRYHSQTSDPSAQLTQLEATIYETPDASKEALNLLTLIAELYNAGVVSSGLIYDLVRGFLTSESGEEVMGEKEVEGLLKILKSCGPQLRSDDPASLKDIVGLVQDKTKGKEKTMTTRARFMVETLTNVKNGKFRTNPGERPGESTERMKRYLSSLGKKRRLLASEPLRVSLADLLSADKKGKWWLIGAGWAGNPLVEREQAASVVPQLSQQVRLKGETKDDEDTLLELARKQGMNTDVRRSVFVVMMTSEDYVHACDRLNHLRLTDKQQRDFIRVALHCCGLEKRYNPYYTLILNHLCSESYDHRFTLQYALWDFLKESGGQAGKETKRRSTNIAKAMAYVVARGSMDLTVFKAIEWTELNSATTSFLTSLLTYLLIATQTSSPLFVLPKAYNPENIDAEAIEEIFEKSLSNSELATGFAVLIRTEMGSKKLGKIAEVLAIGEREKHLVKNGLEIARSVVARAI